MAPDGRNSDGLRIFGDSIEPPGQDKRKQLDSRVIRVIYARGSLR